MNNQNTEVQESRACFIYCRVSTEEQAKEGYSIDAQQDICEQKAKQLGYTVLSVYKDEGQSATVANRPQFLKMIDDVEKGKIRAVLVYHTDRFARNTFDHFIIKDKLKKAGTTLVSVMQPMLDESPEGKLVDTMLAGVNQFYSEDLSRKTKRGLDRKWDEGWWPGWAPLGYMNIKKSKDSKGTVVIDPVLGQVIRWAFEQYASGSYSLIKLIQALNNKGIKTRNGNAIAHSTMQQILKNTFYYGLMRWNGQEKIGNHEALISKKLFDTCQIILARHRNYIIRERKHDFLLRGVIFCAQCGQRYTAEWHDAHSSTRDKVAYYHCAKLQRCKSKYIRSEDLEALVMERLQQIKFSKAFTDAVTRQVRRYLKNKDKEVNKNRKAYLNKRSSLIAKRSVLEDSLLDKTIDRETFKRKHAELQNAIESVDKELAEIESGRNFDFDVLEEILALTRNIPKAYKTAPNFLKKKYLNFFFDQILVDDKNIENMLFSPLITELIEQQKVILRKNWLPG